MEIRDNANMCILAPLCTKLDIRESSRLFKEISNEKRKIAIDLEHVQECTIDFIEKLKLVCTEKNIGIFNIPTDIFVLFNVMNIDKNASLYVSELDFTESSRQLVNRKFSIV